MKVMVRKKKQNGLKTLVILRISKKTQKDHEGNHCISDLLDNNVIAYN